MQKLIEAEYFCYPKNQNLCIYYTDASILTSRLFKALSLQVSPKEGFLLRFRKSKMGHFLFSFMKPEKRKFEVPEKSNCKIIYRNNNNYVFFELDVQQQPKRVFRPQEKGDFEIENFLGYSLFENYSKKEYFDKRATTIKVLQKGWTALLSNEKLHGDFTHFNILLSEEKENYLIDQKEVTNSILFDHFYFYGYYLQCLEKCTTITNLEVSEIKTDLEQIIFETCKSNSIDMDLKNINLEDAIGLTQENKLKYYSAFKQIFKN